MKKALEKQPSDNGTIESLLTSLEQAIEAKKQNDETIAHIRESLAGRIEEMQQAKAMVDRITTVRTDGASTRPSWSFTVRLRNIREVVRQWIMPVVIILLLMFVFVAWYQGFLVPDAIKPTPSSSELIMTATEARLTRQAIELVREDVVLGKLLCADLTIQALSAELPESVRERVLKALGKPDMDFMRDALDILDGKIITKEKR